MGVKKQSAWMLIKSMSDYPSYVRRCRRVRNSQNITTIRNFQVYICVNSTSLYLWIQHNVAEMTENFVSQKYWYVQESMKTFIAVNTRLQLMQVTRFSKEDIFAYANWNAKFCQYKI